MNIIAQQQAVIGPILSSKKKPHLKRRKILECKKRNCHESQRDPKPRVSVLARASSTLLHCTAPTILNSV